MRITQTASAISKAVCAQVAIQRQAETGVCVCVSSGDGGVFPADLLVGQVALGTDNRLRVRLAADYQRLEFLRVLRSQPHERIGDP
ncbi:MAG TPA: hypothetical protein VGP45_04495, partial [Marinobacter sp.]|nr:hypothetical protein [Marinobacter sp.]